MMQAMEAGVMRRLEKSSLQAMKERSEKVLQQAQAQKYDYTTIDDRHS